MILAWILLLAAPARVDVTDTVYSIPASKRNYVSVEIHQDAARVSASYQVLDGSRRVRLALMKQEDVDRMNDDLPYGVIASTPEGLQGELTDRFHRRGDYAVVVDNRDGHSDARVHVQVWLEFGAGRDLEVTMLPRTRQLTVVALSLAAFFGIATYSGTRLWRAVKK